MLIIEDGTAKNNANSFVADADFAAWAALRYPDTTLPAAAAREPHLILAADYLRSERRYRWRGLRKTTTQTMPWPRTGAVERDGLAIASNVIPFRLKEAQYRLALLSLAGGNLDPTQPRGGQVLSKTVGPLSTTFAPEATPETIYSFVDGLLAPLLRSRVDDATMAAPTLTALADVRGFMPGEYDPTEDDGA